MGTAKQGKYDGTRDDIRIVAPGTITPDPTYAERPLSWFLGRHVKKKFPVEDGSERAELMWVHVTGRLHNKLHGVLECCPKLCDLKAGSRAIVSRDEILMVLLTKEEWFAEIELLLREGSYTNEFLGEPKAENGLTFLYSLGAYSPRFALTLWKNFDGHSGPLAEQ